MPTPVRRRSSSPRLQPADWMSTRLRTFSWPHKAASGGILLVVKALERQPKPQRDEYRAPVGLLADLKRMLQGPVVRARATPARTQEASQAGSVSDRVSDAVPAAARSTRAQTESPEPPPERPG